MMDDTKGDQDFGTTERFVRLTFTKDLHTIMGRVNFKDIKLDYLE